MTKNSKKIENNVEQVAELKVLGGTSTVSEVLDGTVSEVVNEPVFDVEAFIKEHKTKSGAIRALYIDGKTTKEIASTLKISYQHVRNVLIQPVKAPLPSREAIAATIQSMIKVEKVETNDKVNDSDSEQAA
jgi:hypothetical protein